MDEFLSLCEADKEDEIQTTSDSPADPFEGSPVTSSSRQEECSVPSSSGTLNPAKSCFEEVSSLDPSEIQKEIERLMQLKQNVIEQARSTVFDSGTAKNGDTSVRKSGLRVVDLNFEGSSQSDQSCSSQQTKTSLGEEESDDEFVDNKKYFRELSETGKLLQKQLNKQEQKEIARHERISYMPAQPIKKTHETAVPKPESKKKPDSPTAFDSFFQIRIRNPKISSSTFESFIDGIKKLHISQLRTTSIPKDGFVTAGVIVNREIRKSASGTDFVVWNLHDLKNCQDKCARLLLFGDAYKEFWKLQVGACVALVNPQIADDNRPDADKKFKSSFTGVTLKAFRRAEVIELGYSSDLGTCKGVKFGGEKCSNFVNTSLSEYCVYHVMNEARKLSAKR
ncbi:primase zinc finger, partial [Oesophagostomum dentatum]